MTTINNLSHACPICTHSHFTTSNDTYTCVNCGTTSTANALSPIARKGARKKQSVHGELPAQRGTLHFYVVRKLDKRRTDLSAGLSKETASFLHTECRHLQTNPILTENKRGKSVPCAWEDIYSIEMKGSYARTVELLRSHEIQVDSLGKRQYGVGREMRTVGSGEKPRRNYAKEAYKTLVRDGIIRKYDFLSWLYGATWKTIDAPSSIIHSLQAMAIALTGAKLTSDWKEHAEFWFKKLANWESVESTHKRYWEVELLKAEKDILSIVNGTYNEPYALHVPYGKHVVAFRKLRLIERWENPNKDYKTTIPVPQWYPDDKAIAPDTLTYAKRISDANVGKAIEDTENTARRAKNPILVAPYTAHIASYIKHKLDNERYQQAAQYGESIQAIGYNRICDFPYACIPVLREDVSEHKWINLAHADFITDCGAFI